LYEVRTVVYYRQCTWMTVAQLCARRELAGFTVPEHGSLNPCRGIATFRCRLQGFLYVGSAVRTNRGVQKTIKTWSHEGLIGGWACIFPQVCQGHSSGQESLGTSSDQDDTFGVIIIQLGDVITILGSVASAHTKLERYRQGSSVARFLRKGLRHQICIMVQKRLHHSHCDC
jgi:hypothetical protein